MTGGCCTSARVKCFATWAWRQCKPVTRAKPASLQEQRSQHPSIGSRFRTRPMRPPAGTGNWTRRPANKKDLPEPAPLHVHHADPEAEEAEGRGKASQQEIIFTDKTPPLETEGPAVQPGATDWQSPCPGQPVAGRYGSGQVARDRGDRPSTPAPAPAEAPPQRVSPLLLPGGSDGDGHLAH